MDLELPDTVRQVLGETATGDFQVWLEDVMEQQTADAGRLDGVERGLGEVRDAVDGLGTRMDGLETRMDGLETRMDGLDTRMGGLDTRMDGLDTRMDSLDTRMDGLETRMGGLETRVEGLVIRTDALVAGLADVRTEVGRLRTTIEDRLDRQWIEFANRHEALGGRLEDRMASQTRWSISLIALFGTLVTTLTLLSP